LAHGKFQGMLASLLSLVCMPVWYVPQSPEIKLLASSTYALWDRKPWVTGAPRSDFQGANGAGSKQKKIPDIYSHLFHGFV
jgi:hypothetical protein